MKRKGERDAYTQYGVELKINYERKQHTKVHCVAGQKKLNENKRPCRTSTRDERDKYEQEQKGLEQSAQTEN